MKLFKKIENLFAASAFAEAGEFDTARTIANEPVEEHEKKTVTPVKSQKPVIGDMPGSLKSAGPEH